MTPYNKQKLEFTLKHVAAVTAIFFGATLLRSNAYDIGCVDTMNNLYGKKEEDKTESDEEDSD